MEFPIIAFSDVLVQLTRGGQPLEPGDADQIASLSSQGIALIVCSEQPAERVKRIQSTLGIAQPIICDGGETVVIPRGYGIGSDRQGREERVFKCAPEPASRKSRDSSGRSDAASRYQRAVGIVVGLFSRSDTDIATVGLTDPTKPDNLQPLVDRTILVGADDDGGGTLRVADWVAAISDTADQLRRGRRQASVNSREWLTAAQSQIKSAAGWLSDHRPAQSARGRTERPAAPSGY